MLNIGKLGAGGEAYYLETVASGAADYYLHAGEAPGFWLGAASRDLGLLGVVEPEALRAVFGATDPSSGEPLGPSPARKVPGFDLTFRAPKSVSMLWGLAEHEVSEDVRRAHDAAVLAALSYLEEQAAWLRRGAQDSEVVPVGGFVAAGFRHRTSRAGDPLLHTHVVVSNLGRAVDDGRWRTLDARPLYQHAKTAGYLYQAHLRHELTRRLGVEWGPVRNGCADLAGIPRTAVREFSRRRNEVEARMAEHGASSAKAAQAATLATRKAKDYGVPSALFRTIGDSGPPTRACPVTHLYLVGERDGTTNGFADALNKTRAQDLAIEHGQPATESGTRNHRPTTTAHVADPRLSLIDLALKQAREGLQNAEQRLAEARSELERSAAGMGRVLRRGETAGLRRNCIRLQGDVTARHRHLADLATERASLTGAERASDTAKGPALQPSRASDPRPTVEKPARDRSHTPQRARPDGWDLDIA